MVDCPAVRFPGPGAGPAGSVLTRCPGMPVTVVTVPLMSTAQSKPQTSRQRSPGLVYCVYLYHTPHARLFQLLLLPMSAESGSPAWRTRPTSTPTAGLFAVTQGCAFQA